MTNSSIRFTVWIILGATVGGVSPSFAARAAEPAASPTLGAAPPSGASVLFDGSNQDAWVSQMDRQWEKSDGPADWNITPEGWLEVAPGTGSLITKERFGDFLLHLEFRLPPGEINGGVYLMARYEVGLSGASEPSERTRCGEFANLQEPIRPLVDASGLAGEWQSLDIEFRAPRLKSTGEVLERARATVVLNGVTIHDDVALGPRKGAAKRLGDAAESVLMLQDHGNSYQFQNIWIVDRGRRPTDSKPPRANE